MKKWHMVIDLEKCIGCYNCYVACKDEHVDNDWGKYSLPQKRHDQRWIYPEHKERGQHPLIDVTYMQKVCMHCGDAPCIKHSLGAITKRTDGIVLIDPVKAKGKDLTQACPYNMITWNEEQNVSQKCTFCAHLIDQGWTKTRCSQACPLEAIKAVYMEDSEFAEMAKREGLEAYKQEFNTKPAVLYKNLYRYTKCFVAGSVAFQRDGIEKCAEGCEVTLFKGNKVIAEQITDNYGDFKFDGLTENSGVYKLEFCLKGYSKYVKEVKVGKSINIGVISFM